MELLKRAWGSWGCWWFWWWRRGWCWWMMNGDDDYYYDDEEPPASNYHHRIITVLFMPLTTFTMNQRPAISQHFQLFHPSMVARWFVQVQLQRHPTDPCLVSILKPIASQHLSETGGKMKWCFRMFQTGWKLTPPPPCVLHWGGIFTYRLNKTSIASPVSEWAKQKQPKKQLIHHSEWFWVSVISLCEIQWNTCEKFWHSKRHRHQRRYIF